MFQGFLPSGFAQFGRFFNRRLPLQSLTCQPNYPEISLSFWYSLPWVLYWRLERLYAFSQRQTLLSICKDARFFIWTTKHRFLHHVTTFRVTPLQKISVLRFFIPFRPFGFTASFGRFQPGTSSSSLRSSSSVPSKRPTLRARSEPPRVGPRA